MSSGSVGSSGPFVVGDRVRHPRFGDGTVRMLNGDDNYGVEYDQVSFFFYLLKEVHQCSYFREDLCTVAFIFIA